MIMLWICVVIGIVVFGAMFVAMFRFRKSKGAVAAHWSHSTKLETIWTVVPILILIGCAWPATKLLIAWPIPRFRHDDQDHRLPVEVALRIRRLLGKQHRRQFHFEPRVRNPTERVNSVRASTRPRSRTTATRPICSMSTIRWSCRSTSRYVSWSPPMTSSTPGGCRARLEAGCDSRNHQPAWTNIDEPGIYRGQCAELCGRDHGFMPIVVKAVPKAEFEQWMTAQSERRSRQSNRHRNR